MPDRKLNIKNQKVALKIQICSNISGIRIQPELCLICNFGMQIQHFHWNLHKTSAVAWQLKSKVGNTIVYHPQSSTIYIIYIIIFIYTVFIYDTTPSVEVYFNKIKNNNSSPGSGKRMFMFFFGKGNAGGSESSSDDHRDPNPKWFRSPHCRDIIRIRIRNTRAICIQNEIDRIRNRIRM